MELDGVYKQLVLAQEIEQLDEGPGHNPFQRQTSNESRMSLTNRMMRASRISDISALERWERFRQLKYYAEILRKIQELTEEHTKPATLCDIIRFARPEHHLIWIGLIATIIRGCTWPIFSVVYGRLFKSLSASLSSNHASLNHENMINAICFAALGLMAGIATFNSGFFFGQTGEKLTMRLRIESFKVGWEDWGYALIPASISRIYFDKTAAFLIKSFIPLVIWQLD